ncbi:MAG: YqeG family HAD IIIA-type phosphatase [Spirulina sp. SIO3F2]|nr:YqeG family HAD IIIA-type phosphatase [Spirulina sp. SIO3F2]
MKQSTLVPLKQSQVPPSVTAWIEQVRPLVAIWLVSNNLSNRRIGGIAQALDLPYLSGARKPSRRKLMDAIAQMDLPKESVAMVGDRLLTDTLAGNRLGVFTILVEPMVDPAIAAQAYKLRNFEIWLMQRLGVSLERSKQGESE